MSETAIRVENLAKLYQIGTQKKGSLRESLTHKWQQLTGKQSTVTADFWALQDVSFEIRQGEAVGIIGKNGAGKSTLLKILSRITEPSRGRIELNGRVASLLEVGTGFHPELSGRENIFLNGTILGMTRKEIKAKFDEIVSFSGVEKFIDTPVKFYSSGMYVRLAFAVAAHLEPEILIIDEVLAVGDAEFQKKCLGKMEDVAKGGRTVVFVSHQMGAVSKLCNRAIFMQKGEVALSGSVEDVIAHYLNSINTSSGSIMLSSTDSTKEIYIKSIEVVDTHGTVSTNFTHNDPILIRIKLIKNNWSENTRIGVRVVDKQSRNIFTTEFKLESSAFLNDQVHLSVKIPSGLLTPNTYFLTIGLFVPNVALYDFHENIPGFSIIETGSDFEQYDGLDYGCVFANCEWSLVTK
jgi:lipopolysaccharide transport system ATP-binding protein